MKIDYGFKCRYTGLLFSVKVSNVEKIHLTPNPAGGKRIVFTANDNIVHGPLLSEITDITITREDAAPITAEYTYTHQNGQDYTVHASNVMLIDATNAGMRIYDNNRSGMLWVNIPELVELEIGE
jgi:hypothetical protein